MNETRRCLYCQSFFFPSRHRPQQRVCSRPDWCTAFALLKSGVDLSTVGHYLGHASPTTTNRYAKVDLEMKRKAIMRVKPVPHQSRTPWSKNSTILDWLESL